MNDEQVSIGPERRTTYRCVTGHEISPEVLLESTEVVSLDEGAVVRVCREHGAPIAFEVLPLNHD